MLQMLKDREIDLLADVSMTPGRQNQRLFSAYAIGMETITCMSVIRYVKWMRWTIRH